MNSSTLYRLPLALPDNSPRTARIALGLLRQLRHGSLRMTLPDGQTLLFGHGELAATIELRNWRMFGASLRDGDIGFAESYIRGDWHCDSLARLLGLMIANRDGLETAIYGSWLGRLTNRLRHLFNRNSRTGSRRNIQAHYDLGNAFYARWLDRSMTYSSALFDGRPGQTLEAAQAAKYQRILDELRCAPGAQLLEIGCGWGGFAEQACQQGLGVDGLTLSDEQLRHARERLDRLPLGENARFALQDYRDEQRRFDGIASIEMFEAVGEAYWPTYFDTVARCLKPGARAVIQTITIDNALFERYRTGSDFIQQYIFPGGMLPSPAAFEAAALAGGLKIVNRHSFGRDYAETLRRWHAAFLDALEPIRGLGFDERFIRTWTFYLAYCEAAFEHGNTDVYQFTLEHA